MLLPGGAEAGAVQLNARAALGKGAHGLKEAIRIDGVDDVVLVFAAVDQPRGQVRDADFMEGDRQACDFLQTFQQQIGNLIGLRNAFGADKIDHMEMIGRDDHEAEFIKVIGAQAQLVATAEICLAAKEKADAVALGQGQGLLYMRDILGLIPFAGAGHGVIPQMVGQAQRAITMRLGHGQHIGRGLPLVMAAGG